MPTLSRCVVHASAIALALASTLHAQSAPANEGNQITTLKVTSTLVVLDVVVTNSKGEVVPNLSQQDFTLLQDGKPQRIRNFTPWSAQPESVTAGTPLTAQQQAAQPLTIFVLDNLNTPFDEQSYSAYTLKRYLERQPETLNSPAMLLQVDDRGLHTLAQYTNQRGVLLSALDKRPASYPNQLANSNNIELLSESFAILRQIALAAEGSRAHKTLVWCGRGFPTLASADLDQPGNAALEAAMQETVTLLTRVRMTLYKVDPITTNARSAPTDLTTSIDQGSGMGASSAIGPINELPLNCDFNFNQFAVQTGGQYFYGRNDLDRQIADSLDRGSHFYTLTYTPPPAPEGKPGADPYRKIEIRMSDPSLKAVTRRGFYTDTAAHPEPTASEMGFDLKLAAAGTMAYSGVAVQVSAVTTARSAESVTVNFTVADRTLDWTPNPDGTEAARITAILVALDADHKVQVSTTANLGLAVKASGQIAKGLLATHAQVAVNAKTRFLRLLVRDSSGRIGSADIPQEAWLAK